MYASCLQYLSLRFALANIDVPICGERNAVADLEGGSRGSLKPPSGAKLFRYHGEFKEINFEWNYYRLHRDSTIFLHEYPKFQASSFMWMYRAVCVGPSWKPPNPVFSWHSPDICLCDFFQIWWNTWWHCRRWWRWWWQCDKSSRDNYNNGRRDSRWPAGNSRSMTKAVSTDVSSFIPEWLLFYPCNSW